MPEAPISYRFHGQPDFLISHHRVLGVESAGLRAVVESQPILFHARLPVQSGIECFQHDGNEDYRPCPLHFCKPGNARHLVHPTACG